MGETSYHKANRKETKPYQSADWATIDKNSGVIHVRWWVPLVIMGGALLIICLSCSLMWGYRRMSSQNRGSSQIMGPQTPGSSSRGDPVKFANMKEAEDAYVDLYNQIDSFCKTVKSPS